MTTEHDRLHAFADGELAPEEAARFRDHLATCDRCTGELHELMMLEAVGDAPRATRSRAPAVVHSLDAARQKRQKRVLTLAALVPVAAAAAFLIHAQLATRGPEPLAQVVLEVDATRSFEPRLAYAAADRYRTYDVARSVDTRAHEPVPLATLAQLEERGDERGLAAGLALAGDTARAAEALGKAGDSVDAEADRAALLLAGRGRGGEALALIDDVLAKRPNHPQALFNRGLALRDLGRLREAADAFDRAAALGEPGWSEEARARGKALRAP